MTRSYRLVGNADEPTMEFVLHNAARKSEFGALQRRFTESVERRSHRIEVEREHTTANDISITCRVFRESLRTIRRTGQQSGIDRIQCHVHSRSNAALVQMSL